MTYTEVVDGSVILIRCPANENLLDAEGEIYGVVKIRCENGVYRPKSVVRILPELRCGKIKFQFLSLKYR